MPIFSSESGFYENEFYVELIAPEGCSIYYTLDSRIPDENAIRYTGPIYIDRASLHENMYSMVEEVALEGWPGVEPDYLIDKCTVIRAVAIKDSRWNPQKSEVITKSYFVGYSEDYFQNCGVISLVTNPDNLFHNEYGIYVTGNIMDKFLKYNNDKEKISWAYWSANYTQRGREWEREANITFYDKDREKCLEKDIGIRIQGG